MVEHELLEAVHVDLLGPDVDADDHGRHASEGELDAFGRRPVEGDDRLAVERIDACQRLVDRHPAHGGAYRWPGGGRAGVGAHRPARCPAVAPPEPIVDRIRELGALLGVDVVPLLAERALDAGFMRSGTVTCGGAGRLVAAADGWIVANLARPEDLESVSAWLEVGTPRGPWPIVEDEVPSRSTGELVARAELLVGLRSPPSARSNPAGHRCGAVGRGHGATGPAADRGRPPSPVGRPAVRGLLADRGAHVIKVESARAGPTAPGWRAGLLRGLHAGGSCGPSTSMAPGRLRRPRWPRRTSVVGGSRGRRALRQLGIAGRRDVRPPVWLSITGHVPGEQPGGLRRRRRRRRRVLVAWDDIDPAS